MQIKHGIVGPQWDDQRAEKAIKEVCLSISGLLNTKNDLSLRWTGCLTDSPLFITRLLSYFLDDWTVSPLSHVQNRQLLKEKLHNSVNGELLLCITDFYLAIYFVPA